MPEDSWTTPRVVKLEEQEVRVEWQRQGRLLEVTVEAKAVQRERKWSARNPQRAPPLPELSGDRKVLAKA